MKSDLLVWNVQGAVSRSFPRVMREYMCDLNPNMVVLIETRVSGAIVNRALVCRNLTRWRLESFQVVYGCCGRRVLRFKCWLIVGNLFI